jgi:hypothetical protein
MEQEYNSKSEQWKDSYERFRIPHLEVNSWLLQHTKFERVIPIAEAEGKTLTCILEVGEDGQLYLDVECK